MRTGKYCSLSCCLHGAVFLTKEMLWPPDRKVWVRFFILTLFISGSLLSSIDPTILPGHDLLNVPSLSDAITDPLMISSHVEEMMFAGTLIILGTLILLFFKSILSFVFVDIIQDRKTGIISRFWFHVRSGLQYFGIYLLILILAGIIIFLNAFFILLPALIEDQGHFLPILDAFVVYFIVSLLCLFPIWIFLIGMYDFIVPVMITDNSSILFAYKTVFSLLIVNKKRFFLYLLIRVTGALAVTGFIFICSLLLISLLSFVFSLFPMQDLFYALCGIGSVLFLTILILTPATTFFRLFSLLFLSSLDPRYGTLVVRHNGSPGMKWE